MFLYEIVYMYILRHAKQTDFKENAENICTFPVASETFMTQQFSECIY